MITKKLTDRKRVASEGAPLHPSVLHMKQNVASPVQKLGSAQPREKCVVPTSSEISREKMKYHERILNENLRFLFMKQSVILRLHVLYKS